jgi:Tfp pilus assembly protein PilZ
MASLAIDRRRGGARVQYNTDALISLPDQSRVVFGRTANLSPSGLFVLSPMVYGMGTQITCTFILQKQKLTLRGRVARVTEAQPSGMGIAFTNLGESVRSLLHDATTLRPQASPQLAGNKFSQPARLKEPAAAPNFTDDDATLIIDPWLGADDARIWNWALALVASGFFITLTTYLLL